MPNDKILMLLPNSGWHWSFFTFLHQFQIFFGILNILTIKSHHYQGMCVRQMQNEKLLRIIKVSMLYNAFLMVFFLLDS